MHRNPVVRGLVASPEDWGRSRLYECISEMKKGSPSGNDAETGERRRCASICSLTNDNDLIGKVIPGIQFIAGLGSDIL